MPRFLIVMGANQTKYLSFLLRMWRVRLDDHEFWRASLEDPQTGERRGFASLEMLIEFLREQMMGDRSDSSQTAAKPDA